MQNDKNNIKVEGQTVHTNIELDFFEALIPVIILVAMLSFNILAKGGEWLGEYSNQYILLIGGAIAAVVGLFNKVTFGKMFKEIIENIKSVKKPIIILLFVGALAGTWLVSGVIPAMVYYGLKVLSPSVFLPASVVISAIIAIATGSSWTTTATVGIALVGIGEALGIDTGIIAGAVISGAYFGDKMSPMSDTTNLAPAMAGTDLFTHIKYMLYTTVPSILITLTVFVFISMNISTEGTTDVSVLLQSIDDTFNISPILFLVPAAVVGMILMKVKPTVALFVGVMLAGVFALFFQQEVLSKLSDSNIKSVVNAIFVSTQVPSENEALADLFASKGMIGMQWTVLLILSAMVFGGVMDAIGALVKITEVMLSVATSTFGLFASTVFSCLGLNIVTSDQYLALVIPGKMFKQAYDDKGLAPENLSRTIEDSGTVTSALIPWNTCGAYQATTLGVGVGEYFIYAVFNYVSPFMTLLFAAFSIKIRKIVKG